MNTMWRVTVCSGAVVGVLGIARAWGQAPEAPLTPLVEIVWPAGVDKSKRGIIVTAEQLTADEKTGEVYSEGNVTVELPNGVRLNINQGTVRMPRTIVNGERRILVCPLPAAPASK